MVHSLSIKRGLTCRVVFPVPRCAHSPPNLQHVILPVSKAKHIAILAPSLVSNTPGSHLKQADYIV